MWCRGNSKDITKSMGCGFESGLTQHFHFCTFIVFPRNITDLLSKPAVGHAVYVISALNKKLETILQKKYLA